MEDSAECFPAKIHGTFRLILCLVKSNPQFLSENLSEKFILSPCPKGATMPVSINFYF